MCLYSQEKLCPEWCWGSLASHCPVGTDDEASWNNVLATIYRQGAEIAQLVKQLGYRPEARDFSLLYSIQTGSGAHPASCAMGIGGCFPGYSSSGIQLATHLQLLLGLRMVALYLHSSIHLHGICLTY
jgi:hypothetical protein